MFKYATADREERNRIERRARARGRDEGRMEAHGEAQAHIPGLVGEGNQWRHSAAQPG